MTSSLSSAQVPFHICDALNSPAKNIELLTEFPYHHLIVKPEARHRGNLFCLNADEMETALAYLGPQFFSASYNIGCWAWELSGFPDIWDKSFDYVHEVWAPSRFVQEAISKKAPVPVICMPQVVEPGPADPRIARLLGVPEDKFSFLFFFDFSSYIARKNPWAVIKAFELAFSGSNAVCLVIKTSGMQQRPREFHEFSNQISRLKLPVVLIDRLLSDAQMKGLISGCDVFVSLHRSEGFGRGLAEAMYYGRPTIGTAYSGNTDFSNQGNSCLVDYTLVPVEEGAYPFGKQQIWAEPDIEHAAWWMQRLQREQALREKIGRAAHESIRHTHGAHAVGVRIANRLKKVGCL